MKKERKEVTKKEEESKGQFIGELKQINYKVEVLASKQK